MGSLPRQSDLRYGTTLLSIGQGLSTQRKLYISEGFSQGRSFRLTKTTTNWGESISDRGACFMKAYDPCDDNCSLGFNKIMCWNTNMTDYNLKLLSSTANELRICEKLTPLTRVTTSAKTFWSTKISEKIISVDSLKVFYFYTYLL